MKTRHRNRRRNRRTRRHTLRHNRKQYRGGNNSTHSLSENTIGEYSAGPLMTKTSPNYMETPDMLGEGQNYANQLQQGGSSSRLVGLSNTNDVLPSGIIGPKSGHPLHGSYSVGPVERPLHIPQSGGKYRKRVRFSRRDNKSRRHRKSKVHTKERKRRNLKTKRRHTKSKSKKNMKGGYNAPYSNEPISYGYSTGGDLHESNSALANPPPIQTYKI